MKKLLLPLIAVMALVAPAFGQVTFGAPKAPKPAVSKDFTTQSASASLDSSLLKVVAFFDNLDTAYSALNYTTYQINGLLPNPLNIGVAGAAKGGNSYWAGPSLGYDFVKNERMSLGIILGLPGVTLEGSDVKFAANFKVIPGFGFSARF